MSTPESQSSFSATRWSLVLRSQGKTPEAKAALGELCEAYYQPVFRFLRREGRSEENALELTQAFFASVFDRGELNADRNRGRFRSYLLGAVKHFLADERKARQRQKRGAGVAPVSLDSESAESEESESVSTSAPSDAFFDRQWALNIMERGLKYVAADWARKGKREQYDVLKFSLMGDGKALSHQEAAQELGWTETAVKVAIHRLRKRFRECILQEITDTTPDPTEAESELKYLIEILRTSASESMTHPEHERN